MFFINKLAITAAIFVLSLNLYAQKFDGTYKGTFSGDLNGNFEFVIKGTGYSSLEGKFKPTGGKERIIYGQIKNDGTIDAYFYDKRSDMSSALWRGTFRGKISGKRVSGDYEVYDAGFDKATTSKGNWSTQTQVEDASMLTASYILGNELPYTDPKAVALRILIKLKDAYRPKYSIANVELVPQVYSTQGRYAPAIDSTDAFHVYAAGSGVSIDFPSSAKEAAYEFPSVDFGLGVSLNLPKEFRVLLKVKLKSIEGGERIEEVKVSVKIEKLFSVEIQNCSSSGCPRLNGVSLKAGQKAGGFFGDELIIPMDARLWVKFLDGTVGYFVNRTDVEWKLTMSAGRFKTTQGSGYAENQWEIKTVVNQGLEAGAGKLTDKTIDAGLEMLFRRAASQSAPGLIVQLREFFGAGRIGGDFISIRLRSKVSVTVFPNGTTRIQNLEGAPEVIGKQGTRLLIPVGKEVMISQKGVIGEIRPIQTKSAETAVQANPSWNGTWQTKWGKMVIIQNGNQITGTYEHDNGKIKGIINGNTLTGIWSEAPTFLPPNDSGEFEMILSPDGKSFTGKWRYGKTGKWEEGWNGNRF